MDKPSGSPTEPICAQIPQSSSPPRKIGIISQSRTDEVYQVKIYLIDVDLDSCGIQEHTRVLPAVRFLFPHTPCFSAICLLNSTVYIFGGYRSNRRYESEAKSAHKFVLSSEVLAKPNYSVELGERTQIAEISVMKFAKGTPAALPTPDGRKIIVFSQTITTFKDSNLAFELYDPNGDYWEQLPPLPCNVCSGEPFPCRFCTRDEILWVKAYSFMDESHFLIEMEWRNELYGFALDLENRAWSVLQIETPRFRGYFVSVKDRYVLSPDEAYDLGDNGYFAEDAYERDGFGYSYEVPLSTFAHEEEEEDEYEPLRCIVPLRPVLENGGVCNTCVLQLKTYELGYDLGSEGLVLIDVCRTELTTLNTTVSNCVRLCIDFLDYMYDISLFSI